MKGKGALALLLPVCFYSRECRPSVSLRSSSTARELILIQYLIFLVSLISPSFPVLPPKLLNPSLNLSS